MESKAITLKENSTFTPIIGYTSSASIISVPINLEYSYGFYIQVSWLTAGTPVGTFTLQSCSDPQVGSTILNNPDSSLVHWITVPSSSQASSGGASIAPSSELVLMWNISNAMYHWVRVAYTVATGSITLTARATVKSFK